jgi:signal transduction histidine kinase
MPASSSEGHGAAVLLEIAREISVTLSLTDCLQRICAITRAALGADRSSVILWSDRKRAMVPAADVGTPPEVYDRFRTASFTAANTPALDQLVVGKTVLIDQDSCDPNARKLLEALGIAAQIIAPLPGRGPASGALTVSYERQFAPSEGSLSLLAGIAHQAAVAIENARLFTNTQKAAEFRAALSDLSLALNQEVDPDRIVELVCEKGRAAFDADGAALLLLEEGVLHVAGSAGDIGAATRGQVVTPDSPGTLVGDVFRSRQAMFVNAFRQSAYGTAPLLRGLSVASVLAAPLLSEGRVSGVLLFTDSKEPYRFSQLHSEEASILATTAAVGLENARLVRALHEESAKLAERSRTLEHANRALAETTSDLMSLNREMEDLLYIASHDLRAPLINIQGFAHEARGQLATIEGQFDSQTRAALSDIEESLRFVHSSSAKMDTLISALLDISRIASRDLERENLDLNAMVRRVVESFEFVLKERQIHLRVGSLPPVHADPVRIEQVFTNLVDNAIKYIGEGRRQVEIGAVLGPVTHYFVRDSGIGLTAAEQKKIFRLFRRGRATGIPGEGIGLTLVRKIIERHGGRIWVESQEGKGTTFWFTLMPAVIESCA